MNVHEVLSTTQSPELRPNPTSPLLLTPEQAAGSLAICRTKVYELLRTGELESVRIGSSRRIPSEALEEYVARFRKNRMESGSLLTFHLSRRPFLADTAQ